MAATLSIAVMVVFLLGAACATLAVVTKGNANDKAKLIETAVLMAREFFMREPVDNEFTLIFILLML